jgi:hypothetical protein
MTPQERQMLNELFDRLASLENAPRDAEAIGAISDGIERAPNALYPLVQTVLVQDEALKRADARIRELEDELGIEPEQPKQQGGFLDSMRNKLSGDREHQGSVPSVRPGAAAQRPSAWDSGAAAPHPNVWGSGTTLPPGYAPAQQSGYPPAQEQAPQGGSFLGTAAATAVGVMGGAMLMNSLRGLFGGQHGQGHGSFSPGGQGGGTPWAPSSGGGDLARQAGVDDIGRGGGSPAGGGGQRAGLFDTAQNDAADSGNNGDFDGGSDFEDDSDTA